MRAFIATKAYIDAGFTPCVILEQDGYIVDIVDTVPDMAEKIFCDGVLLPAFTDIQMNGCDGALFNRDMNMECLQTLHDSSVRHGVTSVFPTLITASDNDILASLALMEQALQGADRMPALEGMHLEGPYIGTTNSGTHDTSLIRPLDDAMLEVLCDYGRKKVLRIISIAPENVSFKQIRALADAGVVVSLGHTGADITACMRAVDAGARLVTHLYNGMPPLANRKPSVVGAAFLSPVLHASIIPDFVHVTKEALRIARNTMGERLFAVTDSTAAGQDGGEIIIGGEVCTVEQGLIKNTVNGSLAGSALFMDVGYNNLMDVFGIDAAIAMCAETPARCVAGEVKKGKIAPGYAAHYIEMRADLRSIKRMFLYGKEHTESRV